MRCDSSIILLYALFGQCTIVNTSKLHKLEQLQNMQPVVGVYFENCWATGTNRISSGRKQYSTLREQITYVS